MSKFIPLILVCAVAFAPIATHAAGLVKCDPSVIGSCDICALLRTIDGLVKTVLGLAFVGLTALTAFAAYKMAMSEGDPKAFKDAWDGILKGIVGIVIMFSAWLIIATVIRFFARADSPIQFWNEIQCIPMEQGTPPSTYTCTNITGQQCGPTTQGCHYGYGSGTCPAGEVCCKSTQPPPPPGCIADGLCKTSSESCCNVTNHIDSNCTTQIMCGPPTSNCIADGQCKTSLKSCCSAVTHTDSSCPGPRIKCGPVPPPPPVCDPEGTIKLCSVINCCPGLTKAPGTYGNCRCVASP